METEAAIENIDTLTVEVLRKTLDFVEGTESFVLEQAPLFVQDILTRGIIFEASCLIGWTVVAVIAFCFGRMMSKFNRKILITKNAKNGFDLDSDDAFCFIAKWFLYAITVLFSTVNVMSQGGAILTIILAPRYYIVESLQTMIGS